MSSELQLRANAQGYRAMASRFKTMMDASFEAAAVALQKAAALHQVAEEKKEEAKRYQEQAATLEQAACDIDWALEHMVFVDDPVPLEQKKASSFFDDR